ncbi:MAG: HAD-IIIC family phosphatase [Bacteroidaceae bacterium]|nr:HAD-IIIC family phosphatase [Bacteroidaceae bacterium]
MHTFQQLRKAAKRVGEDAPAVRIALCGDTATQLLATALRGEGALRGLCPQLFEADYDQVEQQLLQPHSALHRFGAHYVVLYRSVRRFAARHAALPTEAQANLADDYLQLVRDALAMPQMQGRTLIVLNLPDADDGVYGGYASSVPASLLSQVRCFNAGLQALAAENPALRVCDVAMLQARIGRDALFDDAVYATTELEFSLTALPQVAALIYNTVCAARGSLRKVLVTDLDNTLWGGVVGDDGWEALQIGHHLGIGRVYTELQQWMKKLVRRGVILCVVSKNDEAVARLPFEHHPDMVLRLDDVAVFQANWDTKADNILRLAEILHIGTDQMVFLDDNPFERAIVREGVPGIAVPELDADPARWLSQLSASGLFETAAVSSADAARTRQYREEAARVATRRRFEGEDDFLASLQMRATVEGLTPFNLPRAAQLTQRSNQFNLRTVRYTEAALSLLAADERAVPLCFSLADRFGDAGLVSVVILRRTDADTLFIDTWLMSCRVLRRGMEQFVANTLVATARRLGARRIEGEYLPTAKNAMVAGLLPSLGFRPVPAATTARFTLDVSAYSEQPCHIS